MAQLVVAAVADSLLIAISQLLTVEVARPLWPAASPRQVTRDQRVWPLVCRS